MDPNKQKIIIAGEAGFREGLATARARGGPVKEIDALCACGTDAPVLLSGERLSRMTLGIQRLVQKRAAMPDTMDGSDVLLFFARGPQVAELFTHYSEEDQAWTDPAAREAYEDLRAETDSMADETIIADVNAWLMREFQNYNRLAHDDAPATSKSASAGTDGSRVGWWLRAVEGICAHYAAACPPGREMRQWAVWEFPLNDYLALQPAAHERAGHELPEHYAVREAREARRAAKRKAETEAAAASKRVKVCGVDCFPEAESCNGYCKGKADRPPAAEV